MKRNGITVMLKLVGLVKPLTGYMFLAVILGLFGHLCATFITVLGVYGVLNLLSLSEVLSLRIIFISVIVFAIFRAVLRYGEQTCNHYIAFNLLAIIRDKVFKALRQLCPAKLEGRDKGDLISIITSDIELLEVFYAHTISPIAIWALFTIVMTFFIGQLHFLLGLLAFFSYFVVGVLIPIIVAKNSGDSGIHFRNQAGALSAFVLDSLRGLSETQQYDAGENQIKSLKQQSKDLSDEEAKMKSMAGKNIAITNSVILVLDLMMIFLSLFLWENRIVPVSTVLIATISLFSSFGPSVALAALGSTLQNTFAAGNRVLDVLEENPMVEDVKDGMDIEFHDCIADKISFSYGGEKIIDDLTLRIPENQIIGIVGCSGSGKSTLLKLFMRFWQTQKGKITISGVDVENINTGNLRNMESFVTQDTQLFHDSIRNNLRIARLNASEEEIISACKKAAIHDFIVSLPNSYDTPVGELGDTLSGGERQRIGLARAFLHNAPFMLLDEPTSNLDSLNEAIILRSLKEERENKTVVLVSHRESTMRIADTVYNVENGRMS